MSIDTQLATDHSIELSIHLWRSFSRWLNNLGEHGHYTAPEIGMKPIVAAVSPTVFSYLTDDANTALSTRVKLLLNSIDLAPHHEWAASARLALKEMGLKGDKEDFKLLSVETPRVKSEEKKALILSVVAEMAKRLAKECQQTHEVVEGLERPKPVSKRAL